MSDSGESASLVQVEVVGDHRLKLTFVPVVTGELGFEHQVWPEGAEDLADSGYFGTVFLDDESGALKWPNDYTMQPDPLYKRLRQSPKPPNGNGKDGGATLVTVAGAVASGLGVLGFVTFAGGVVLWSRFKGMGLPADHALGVVPKSELVATGADFLVPAVLLSALSVLIAVLISSLPVRVANTLSPGESPPGWALETPEERRRKSRRAIAPVILWFGGMGFSIAAFASGVPLGAFAILAGVSTLGALVVRACGDFKFPAFCLVAFLAAGTFAIARTYERTSHRLEVLPMAYTRYQSGEAPRVEFGYFVAETSDRIIFASLPESKKTSTDMPTSTESPNELREFPRSETDDLEIGDLARPAQAVKDAAHFAYNLCERLAHLERPPPQPNAPPVCRGGYVQELAEKAGLPWPPPVKNIGYVEAAR